MPETETVPEQILVTARDWSAGNGPLMIPLAGLLCAQPHLARESRTPQEWRELLDEYLRSPCP